MTTLNLDVVGRDKGALALLRNLSKESTKTATSLEKTTKATSGFGSLTGLAFKAAGVAAVGYGLKIASANEQAKVSFTTMLGSAQKADVFLKQLQQFAATTPFEFPELQTAASSLISAGISANKVIPIMRTLGDVTAGMGTGSEGIKRATVALQQMNAAGKITAEDLNQLRDAGIPVYDLLAAATHKSTAEVTAMAAAGKLGRKELDQLMTALESGKGLEKFNGLMAEQSKTLAGMVSTLKDVSSQMLAGWLEPLLPAVKASIGALADMNDTTKATVGILAGSAGAFAVAISGASKLSGAFQTLGTSAKVANIAVGGVTAVLGLATLAFGLYASEHAKAKADVDEFTQALEGETAAVQANVRTVAAKQLQDEGALKAAQDLGLSLADVTDAVLGQNGALERIQPLLDGYVEAGVNGTIADQDRATAAGILSDAIKGTGGAYNKAVGDAKQMEDATKKSTAALGGQEEKAVSAKDALKQWRTEMFKSADAALDLAGSQDAVEAAIDDATESVKDNGKTLDNNTEKGRNNRAALRDIASASNRYREKLDEQGASTKKVNRATDDAREAFIKVAGRMGLGRKEAGKLADEFGLVKRKTDDAARATRGYDRDVNNLNNKTIKLVAQYRASATAGTIKLLKNVPGSQASGFAQALRGGGPSPNANLDSMVGAPVAPPGGARPAGGPTFGATKVKVDPQGLKKARAMGQSWDDVARAAYLGPAMAARDAIGKLGQTALENLLAGGAPGGAVGAYSATMAGTIAALRKAGARSFTTYPGHHPSAAKARDVTPHSWKIANTARASRSVWYVIYQMRIASKNHGNTWRAYHPTNHRGDWQHRRHVHVAWYDKGGLLRSGGLAGNMSGKPERVLSAAQTKSFDHLVKVISRNQGGAVGNTYIVNAPNYVGDKRDLVKALTDLDRQGRLAVVRR